MNKTLVLMKNVKYGYETVIELDDGEVGAFYSDDEYVMLSEAVDVDFHPLSDAVVVAGQVAVIEKQMVKVRADAEASITALEGRKQDLLALECDS